MTRRRLALCCALLAAAGVAGGGQHGLPLWQVEGAGNRVYLLGSVHLLRPADYPLPDEIYAAYADAEILVMELDLDDLDRAAMAEMIAALGGIADGGSLAALLGDADYRRATALAQSADIPLDSLESVEPWLAAITIEQLLLTRLGFDPALGIENHLAGRAAQDGKEIHGLETLRQQLGAFDGLSLETQRRLLLGTLEESAAMPALMEEILRAWRTGDVESLASIMLADMRDEPELYRALVVSRNRAWTTDIEALLDDDEDYLVVVGALHLVGPDGVPQMLERRGHTAAQLFRAASH